VQYRKWLNSTDKPENDSPTTKLGPFCLDGNNTLHDSKTVSFKHDNFGYTYPELQRWKFPNDDAYLRSIRVAIDALYPTTDKASLLLKDNTKPRAALMKSVTADNLRASFFPPEVVKEAPQQVREGAKVPESEVPESEVPPDTPAEATSTHLSWESNDYVVNVVYKR